ncbi:hypothetical protein G7Y89_g8262 [Cudoniella acicularis]|uniref:Cytochrome P450 n=1 Tax=Cudoniella acicularis TaxID=354080 RepID=A0A8H4RIG6_9HELO|nr:hypothetical protein G7Y89_g8262 [Cudoniella acicularis]
MASFGLIPSTPDRMFQETFDGKSWMDICHENFKLQIHPGEKLKELHSTFLGNIDKSLQWDRLSGSMVLSNTGDEEKYLALQEEQRQDASWIAGVIEEGIKGLGIHEESQASSMLYVLFRLINTNAYRLCFWCLAHLPHNKVLLAEIIAEIQPAFQIDGKINMSYLLEHCPILASLYEEILRISNYPIGVRVVTSEVVVGDKLLRPGRQLLMPYAQMHFNPEVFSSDAGEFEAKHLLHNKNFVRSTSYRPFSGGSTQCPGRFLARHEVYMFLAQLLNRFDITLAAWNGNKASFPKMDGEIPSGGVMGPAIREDVVVKVRSKRRI